MSLSNILHNWCTFTSSCPPLKWAAEKPKMNLKKSVHPNRDVLSQLPVSLSRRLKVTFVKLGHEQHTTGFRWHLVFLQFPGWMARQTAPTSSPHFVNSMLFYSHSDHLIQYTHSSRVAMIHKHVTKQTSRIYCSTNEGNGMFSFFLLHFATMQTLLLWAV